MCTHNLLITAVEEGRHSRPVAQTGEEGGASAGINSFYACANSFSCDFGSLKKSLAVLIKLNIIALHYLYYMYLFLSFCVLGNAILLVFFSILDHTWSETSFHYYYFLQIVYTVEFLIMFPTIMHYIGNC